MTKYVNCIILSKNFKRICYIFKTHGPEFLLNKYNFVGGKLEDGENFIQAAKREVLEESGLNIEESNIVWLNTVSEDTYTLYNTVAFIDNNLIETAYTAEKEEVLVSSVDDVVIDMWNNPKSYNPGFSIWLKAALNTLKKEPE